MSDWAFLNKHRVDYMHLKADPAHGCNGCFEFTVDRFPVRVIASDGTYGGVGWKHISVTVRGSRKPPHWEVMCKIKDLFWDPEDWVVQFHPAHSAYVNNHPGCLHLWQPLKEKLPIPPAFLVGAKAIGLLPKDPTPAEMFDIVKKVKVASRQADELLKES